MGRARRSDGDITRESILEAAGELIAEKGFAQTPSKEIAKKAGVDLAAINYHFGGRDGLYLAVLALAHHHHLDGQQLVALADSGLAAEEKLGMFLETFLSNLNNPNSWHGRVFARELLSPSVQLEQFLNSEGAVKIQAVRRIISEAAGIPEDDPRILPCMLSVVAPCVMLIVAGNRMPGPVQQVVAMQTKALTAHFKLFALAGLKAVGGTADK